MGDDPRTDVAALEELVDNTARGIDMPYLALHGSIRVPSTASGSRRRSRRRRSNSGTATDTSRTSSNHSDSSSACTTSNTTCSTVKILVTSTPGLGHVIPLVPLAQAFLRQGHEVRWATGADAGPTITAAGVPFTAAGLTGVERHTAYRTRYPDGPHCNRRNSPRHVPRLFGEISLPATLEAVLPIAANGLPISSSTKSASSRRRSWPASRRAARHGGLRRTTPRRTPRRHRRGRRAVLAGPRIGTRPRCGSYDHLYLDIIRRRSTRASPTRSRRASRCARSRSTSREATTCRSGWRGTMTARSRT